MRSVAANAAMLRYRRAVQCPYCKALDDRVVDSRLADGGAAVRRRRECVSCGRRYTTFERLDPLPFMVVKRSGGTEPFDRSKLARGIAAACAGRPVDVATVERMAAELEEELHEEGAEVTTEAVGLAVLERLRALDPVCYLRFASVYKGFEDLADFEREVVLLQKTTAPKSRGAPTPR